MQLTKSPSFLLFFVPVLASACTGGDGDSGTPSPDAGTQSAFDAARSPLDAAVPLPDAAPLGTACQAKDPVVQLGYTCNFVWSQCSDGDNYTLDCQIENVGGNVFSLCDCIVNGSVGMQTLSSQVCSQADWPSVEAIVNDKCGWDLR